MKLLFDLSSVSDISQGFGVVRYALNMLQGLYDSNIQNITLLLNERTSELIHKKFPHYPYILFKTSKTSWNRYIMDGLKWKYVIDSANYDIVFCPICTKYAYWPTRTPRVQTIHDLQGYKVFSGKFLIWQRLTFPLIIKNSDRIIAISKFVETDIHTFFKNKELPPIKVIYNSVIPPSQHEKKIEIDSSYILYVSCINEYKNLITLLKALTLISNKIHHKLVIVGNKNSYWEETLYPFIKLHKLEERIILLSKVSDSELLYLYRHATVLVSPSKYEGFGYSPIEAAILKIPVLSSKETALHETTRGLVYYYHPVMDASSLGKQLINIIKEPPSQKELEKISSILSTEYDYKSQALKVYQYCEELNKKNAQNTI